MSFDEVLDNDPGFLPPGTRERERRMWRVEVGVWLLNDVAAAILARAAARGVTIGDVVAEAWEAFAATTREPGDP